MDMDVLENTGSTPEVEVMPEVSTITESTATSTIPDSSVRLVFPLFSLCIFAGDLQIIISLLFQVGMRVFHLNKNHHYCPTVNVDRLWSLVPETIKEKAAADKAPVIDCVKAGYFKVRSRFLASFFFSYRFLVRDSFLSSP